MSAVSVTTVNDVTNLAQKYVDPDHLVILIVGDKAKIIDAIKATNIGPVVELD